MNILIVDDEPLARLRLTHLLRDLEPEARLFEAATTSEAVQKSNQEPMDLVLLDIHMPGTSGLSWLKELKQQAEPPAVIMITAYSEHALQALQQGANGYLLKPVKREDLAQALAQSKKTHRLQRSTLHAPTSIEGPTHPICVYVDGTGDYVKPLDILYCSAEGRWVKVVTQTHEYMSDRALKDWEVMLQNQLVRIHRGILINPEYVAALRRQTGQYSVVLRNDVRLPVSRRHAKAVKQRIQAAVMR